MTKLLTLAVIFVSLTLFATANSKSKFITHYESSNFLETPRYQPTIDYCNMLASSSDMISTISIGTSPQGRDIVMMIVDKDGYTTPEQIKNAGKTILLVDAAIHAGEPCGKDAGLMFIRDMVIDGVNIDLLDNISLIFIPIFSPDGHENFSPYGRFNQNGPLEMGYRITAQNLNLNRDFLKADGPEMRAFLKMFNSWLPDLYINTHCTDGADYQYVLTYIVNNGHFLDPEVDSWQTDYENSMVKTLDKRDTPIFPYVQFRTWHDPRSGLCKSIYDPMYSTGYGNVMNRPSVITESHMLKPYQVRVDATYEVIKFTMEYLKKNGIELHKALVKSDRYVASNQFRKNPFPINFKLDTTDSTMVDFKGVEYDMIKSDISGGDWFRYSDKPIVENLPFFQTNKPSVYADVPKYYVVPVEWSSVRDVLDAHQIEYSSLEKDSTMLIGSYRFSSPKFSSFPKEGRQTVTAQQKTTEGYRTFPKGSLIVPTSQRNVKVLIFMLEPAAKGSLFYWGFFNTIFEKVEYAASYRMEIVAREMLKSDPNLKARFEKKLKEDPKFAASSSLILDWFFKQTPHYSSKIGEYPIGKIF